MTIKKLATKKANDHDECLWYNEVTTDNTISPSSPSIHIFPTHDDDDNHHPVDHDDRLFHFMIKLLINGVNLKCDIFEYLVCQYKYPEPPGGGGVANFLQSFVSKEKRGWRGRGFEYNSTSFSFTGVFNKSGQNSKSF